MGLILRPANTRGTTEIGWLHSHHTFSFGDYYDPQHERFHTLRVINDDIIEPDKGFGTHPHRNMEIVTVVFSGELHHADSMGHREVLRAGEVQAMSAGRGITHSEFNGSATDAVHLLQIWIEPERLGVVPQYNQKSFAKQYATKNLIRVAGKPKGDSALEIHQDADIFVARFDKGDRLEHHLKEGRVGWIQVALGSITVNGTTMSRGDGASIEVPEILRIEGAEPGSAILLFDLAAGR